MRGITDTIARLKAAAAARGGLSDDGGATHLRPLAGFGSNPGALSGWVHVPASLAPAAPLVVVLHGCTQSAAAYDRASGWSVLAEEQGFALFYAEQQRANNAQRCFNWFAPGDTRRGQGEVESIRQMIAAVTDRHAIDPARVFVTGLSAGGAMAATMLATHPELFAGGAIIAGLPHGVADGMVQAFDRMRGHGLPDGPALQAALRRASGHAGRWPRLSVWHGSADTTVSPHNAEAILAQWRGVHGADDAPSVVDEVDGVPHRAWRDSHGEIVLEAYIVPGMGHGVPLKATGTGAYGVAAPFMLDVGIASSARIARFWGICDPGHARAQPSGETAASSVPARVAAPRLVGRRIEPDAKPPSSDVGRIIEDALRAAGLMK